MKQFQNKNTTKRGDTDTKFPINIIYFFLITFIFTWIFWIPDALAKQGIIERSLFTKLGFIGSLGPLIASFVLVFKESGKEGLVKLFIKNLNKKIEIKWWVIIFLLFPILIITSYYFVMVFYINCNRSKLYLYLDI